MRAPMTARAAIHACGATEHMQIPALPKLRHQSRGGETTTA